MKKVIELTRELEAATIAYGNAQGLVEKEVATHIMLSLREELNHAIRQSMR